MSRAVLGDVNSLSPLFLRVTKGESWSVTMGEPLIGVLGLGGGGGLRGVCFLRGVFGVEVFRIFDRVGVFKGVLKAESDTNDCISSSKSSKDLNESLSSMVSARTLLRTEAGSREVVESLDVDGDDVVGVFFTPLLRASITFCDPVTPLFIISVTIWWAGSFKGSPSIVK